MTEEQKIELTDAMESYGRGCVFYEDGGLGGSENFDEELMETMHDLLVGERKNTELGREVQELMRKGLVVGAFDCQFAFSEIGCSEEANQICEAISKRDIDKVDRLLGGNPELSKVLILHLEKYDGHNKNLLTLAMDTSNEVFECVLQYVHPSEAPMGEDYDSPFMHAACFEDWRGLWDKMIDAGFDVMTIDMNVLKDVCRRSDAGDEAYQYIDNKRIAMERDRIEEQVSKDVNEKKRRKLKL
ncbi:MAG TPA: hypothetical protein VM577_03645 [Anaerovoracaceae bacterium]|nr:hypothetical protein [Anaerovoracaceae bacterium]